MTEIVAIVSDLIFSTKISSTARGLGVPLRVFAQPDSAVAAASTAPVVIVDLNLMGADPIDVIRRLAALCPRPRIVGYVSHVQVDRVDAARQAGADVVMPRSAFSAQLAQLLGDWHRAGASAVDGSPAD